LTTRWKKTKVADGNYVLFRVNMVEKASS